MTSTATSLSFTEEMKGYVTFGEPDFDRGYRLGREAGTFLMFHLTIRAEGVAAGILHIYHLDFAKQLTTFRVEAPTPAARAEALVAFGRYFLGSLWDVHGPRLHAGPAAPPGPAAGKREIALFTLEGVP